MDPIVLVGSHGHRTAFKITTAKVYSLECFIMSWRTGEWNNIYLAYLNEPEVKPRKLTAALIRNEFPQYVDTSFYRSINY